MFVIFCYDVNVKRNSKINKLIRKYLRPVQKSVYEGYITDSKLNRLCGQVKDLIDPVEDSVVIYKLNSESSTEKTSIGQTCNNDDFIL